MVLGFLVSLAACSDRWGEEHEPGKPLTVRPECPVDWGDSIPWFSYRTEKDPVTVPSMVAMAGGVPGTGPITDIPEFHDCQRFVTSDEQHFDSLFAIFASYRQDSITAALQFEPVTWASSSAVVATVSATGMVTAVATGTVTITARSVADPTVIVAKDVVVTAAGATMPRLIQMGQAGTDTIGVGEQRQAVALVGVPTAETLPVATVYSYGQFYPPLGIEPNFNCLYLYFDGRRRLKARMIPVEKLGGGVTACNEVADMRPARGTDLTVTRTSVAFSEVPKENPYPAVARWDWDPNRKRQFAGLGCATAWCEVGTDAPPSPFIMPPGTPEGDQRVVSIKGWHDEQMLAAPADPADDDSELVPSSLRATVIPHPDLADQGWQESTTPPPGERWRTAAYIAVRDLSGGTSPAVSFYKERLNLDLVDLGRPLKDLNEMAYCYGRAWQCGGWSTIKVALSCDAASAFGKRWWVRITPAATATSPEAKVLCIKRRTHATTAGSPAMSIPSTSRWRWILRDDTVWTECVQGCCETQVGGF